MGIVPMKATDTSELERMIMDSTIAKSESAWWASYEINKLRKELAEREAENLKLREALKRIADECGYSIKVYGYNKRHVMNLATCNKALSTPPSTSYLEEWEKEKYSPAVKTGRHHTAVRDVLKHHKLTEVGDGVVEADLIYAVLGDPAALYTRKD